VQACTQDAQGHLTHEPHFQAIALGEFVGRILTLAKLLENEMSHGRSRAVQRLRIFVNKASEEACLDGASRLHEEFVNKLRVIEKYCTELRHVVVVWEVAHDGVGDATSSMKILSQVNSVFRQGERARGEDVVVKLELDGAVR
jgi:hypothetical protein